MRKRIAFHRGGFWGRPDQYYGSWGGVAPRRVPYLAYSTPSSNAVSFAQVYVRDLANGYKTYILGTVPVMYKVLNADVTLTANNSWQEILSFERTDREEGLVVMVIAAVTFSVNLSSTGGRALHVRISSDGTNPSLEDVGYTREWVYTNAGTRLVTLYATMFDTYSNTNETYRVYVATDNITGVTVKGTPSGSNLTPSQYAKTAMWVVELGFA